MRRPWSVLAAWEFVSALLASPGLALLVPTQRHADVAGKVTPRASNAAAVAFFPPGNWADGEQEEPRELNIRGVPPG
jgi:hypothetical protein